MMQRMRESDVGLSVKYARVTPSVTDTSPHSQLSISASGAAPAEMASNAKSIIAAKPVKTWLFLFIVCELPYSTR